MNMGSFFYVQHFWARGYFCGMVGVVDEDMIRKYIEGQQVKGEDVFDIQD